MKRIRGQMETIERTLGAEGYECADVLSGVLAFDGNAGCAARLARPRADNDQSDAGDQRDGAQDRRDRERVLGLVGDL